MSIACSRAICARRGRPGWRSAPIISIASANPARNRRAISSLTVPRDPQLLPPVVDIEFGGNCPDRPSVDQFRAELAAYLAIVEPAFGKQAIIYIIGEAADGLWRGLAGSSALGTLAGQCIPATRTGCYWQYHNKGRVDGIAGDVDLNVLQGSAETLARLIGSAPGS